MRAPVLSIVLAGLLTVAPARTPVRAIGWEDVAPLRAQLETRGISAASFPAYVARIHADHARRIREGDLDHLVFYLLQSTHFTSTPPIEPALSAKGLVDGLEPRARERFLADPASAPATVPTAVRTRVAAMLEALDSSSRDPRLQYFRELVAAAFPARPGRTAALNREYLRVMRFVYEKEFVAQRAGGDAVAELYRRRGLSTDTAVEAGYVVYLGLGIVKSLQPDHRIRRVLIVGPGLDLAPRTGLIETGPPVSYQPWAVIDALLGLGLSVADDLDVVGADINPRVVQHLRRARSEPPTLSVASGIQQGPAVSIVADYRDYFSTLGQSIGARRGGVSDASGRLRKTIPVGRTAAHALSAETLDIVTQSLDGPPFDVVIATNVLPYFDDAELILAMGNVARMLAPGGVFLHNEARPILQEIAAALGMPAEQSRRAVIAAVAGAPAPLFDSVWIHRKAVP